MCQHHEKDTDDITACIPSLSNPFRTEGSTDYGASEMECQGEGSKIATTEDAINRAVEVAVAKAIFGGDDVSRRNFMKLVGSSTALAVISSIFPLEAAKAWANESPGPLEKRELKIGFIPITCGAPILMAEPLKLYDKHGLTGTKLQKAKGWTMIRDWALERQVDCVHMLSPMPLAITMGVGTPATPFCMLAVENVNGQAITLHTNHKGITGPKDMKGLTFAVPFEQSMHNFLLRYYLAEGGVDPDKDVKIRELPPPNMVEWLKTKRIDGYLSPDPYNQRAVYDGAGYIFKLTKELWPGHPCCAFATTKAFATEMPNSFKAVFRTIVESTIVASKPENRKQMAKYLSGENYLNQPVEVLEQVLTGEFPDGLGNMRSEPDRIDFNPFPWHSMAVWILVQMKRWGYIKGDVDYKKVAEQVFLASECADTMKKLGFDPPSGTYQKHRIMGKEFDPGRPVEYLSSFSIKRI
jgi:nitrate/nitrite transport system substrate-binding protein